MCFFYLFLNFLCYKSLFIARARVVILFLAYLAS